jgi:hypothetical protein
MLSDGFDLHRCLSLEKDGGEISVFLRRLLKRGEMNDARRPVGSVFPSAIQSKMFERLSRLLRIVRCSPECGKKPTAVQNLGCCRGQGE